MLVAPQALRDLPQWVVWRAEPSKDGKPTKMPYVAANGRKASTTKPADWCSFDDAVAAAERDTTIDGVGFVFTADDHLCGVDLDDCIVEGVVTPGAQAILDSLASYAEVSPSGTGVKVFLRARKPDGARSKSKVLAGMSAIEIYDRARYFTVTGKHLAGTPLEVNDRQAELEELCARAFPPKAPVNLKPPVPASEPAPDDDELLRRMFAAKNGHAIERLWNGDASAHGDDANGADLALCCHLAFWTCRDADHIDRLFRRSGLFRAKWDERRGPTTYGAMTIAKAIEGCAEVYSPRGADARGAGCGIDADVRHPGSSPSKEEVIAAIALDDGYALGEPDPETGKLVLCPRRTLPTANAFVRDFYERPDGRTILSHAGALHRWEDNRYVEVDERLLEQQLQPWLHDALQPVRVRGHTRLEPFNSNPATVSAALKTILPHIHVDGKVSPPCWLSDRNHGLNAHDLLPCRTTNYHIPTAVSTPATPDLFVRNALPIDIDPKAAPPARWIAFINDIFEGDMDSIRLLQEWFGYCLVPDTSQQKILLVVGPKRCGKGTMGRILTALVGEANVVGPTTTGLSSDFGLQSLLDRSIAIISDARFRGASATAAIERMLCISGEDLVTVERKFKGSITTKLTTRFMILTNELPRLPDSSGAITSRFLVLKINKSFYGQEDVALTAKLMAEMPGILNWALDGLESLRRRGHFAQPDRARDAIQELEDLGSPIGAFVRTCCVTGAGQRAYIDSLWSRWKEFCDETGIESGSKLVFCRDLRANVAGLGTRRRDPQPFYAGIGLKESE